MKIHPYLLILFAASSISTSCHSSQVSVSVPFSTRTIKHYPVVDGRPVLSECENLQYEEYDTMNRLVRGKGTCLTLNEYYKHCYGLSIFDIQYELDLVNKEIEIEIEYATPASSTLTLYNCGERIGKVLHRDDSLASTDDIFVRDSLIKRVYSQYDEQGRITLENVYTREEADTLVLSKTCETTYKAELDTLFENSAYMKREASWFGGYVMKNSTQLQHKKIYDSRGQLIFIESPGYYREERSYNRRGFLISTTNTYIKYGEITSSKRVYYDNGLLKYIISYSNGICKAIEVYEYTITEDGAAKDLLVDVSKLKF